MKYLLFIIVISTPALAARPIVAYPLFLKKGYSGVVNFTESPARVVLGDSKLFQIERLKSSLIIRPLFEEATSNLFVFFKTADPKLFLLSAKKDADPNFYLDFDYPVRATPVGQYETKPKLFTHSSAGVGFRVIEKNFSDKRDYLLLKVGIRNNDYSLLNPIWDASRLKYKGKFFAPSKVWAERKSIFKSSEVRATFEFTRPGVLESMEGVELVIPLSDSFPLNFPLKSSIGGKRQ